MTQRVSDQYQQHIGDTNFNHGGLQPGMMRPQMHPGMQRMPMNNYQMQPGMQNMGGMMQPDPNYAGNGRNYMMPNLGQFMGVHGNVHGNMMGKPSPESMLLSPDHFMHTMVANQAGDSPLTAAGLQGVVNPALVNMDIPKGNFMNAMKFGAGGNECVDQHNTSIARDAADSQIDEGDLLEQSMESNGDLLEQKQAIEQARLMERFKKLREIQVQQQQMLMQQQQDQLLMLRSEQERVQRMIAKQREMQWGGGAPPNAQAMVGMTMPQMNNMPQQRHNFSPTKNQMPLPHSQSTLPHAIAQSTMAMARMNAGMEIPRQLTPSHAQGRPVPHLREVDNTPSEYLENGNPDLNSDTNTIESRSMEDGMCPAFEAVGQGNNNALKQNSLSHQSRNPVKDYDQDNSDKENKLPRGKKDDSLRKALFMGSNSTIDSEGDPNLQTTQQSLPFKTYHNVKKHAMQGSVPDARDEEEEAEDENEVLDYRDESDDEEDVDDEEYDEEDGVIDEEEVSEYDEEVDEETQEATEPDSPKQFDDLPVGGISGAKKTFEELLEEELRKEEERLREQSDEAPGSKSGGSGKQCFLKKGDGVARYGMKSNSGPKKKPVRAKPKTSPDAPVSRSQGQHPDKTKEVSRKLPIKNSPPKQGLQLLKKANQPAKKKEVTGKPPIKPTQPASSGAQSSASNSKIPRAAPSNTKLTDGGHSSNESVPDEAVRDSVGDISFQHCMQRRQNHEAHEKDELDEFEILEQYADDNASFMSSVSAVKKVVHNDKQKRVFGGDLKKKLAEKEAEEADNTLCDDIESMSESGSSTEEDDTEEENEEDSEADDSDHGVPHDNNKKDINTFAGGSQTSGYYTADQFGATTTTNSSADQSHDNKLHPVRTMQRKVVSMDKRSPRMDNDVNHLAKVEHFSEDDDYDEEEDSQRKSRLSSLTAANLQSSQYGATELQSQTSTSQGALNPASSNFTGEEPPQGEEAVVSSRAGADNAHKEVLNFDDDEEWEEDTSQLDDSGAEDIVNEILQKKPGPPAFSRGKVDSDPIQGEVASPPTSKLVSKLFPNLRQEKPKPQVTAQQEQKLAAAKTVEVGDGIQSNAIREKLLELEKEIEKFRRENGALSTLRKEREDDLHKIKKEISEFEKQKDEELKRIQEYKSEEMKKIKKERKVFDQYQKAARAMPDKKEREEIETLKQQISELQDEMKRKEQRWTSSTSRLRDRVEQLETENTELKAEIKVIEKKRLDLWQSREQSSKTKQPSHAEPKAEESKRSGPVNSRLPRLEQQPRPLAQNTQTPQSRNNPLRQSCSLDLDTSIDFHEYEDSVKDESIIEPKFPQNSGKILSPGSTHHNEAPRPFGATSGPGLGSAPHPAPAAAFGGPQGAPKPLPRKKAIALGLLSGVDKGDEKFEEVDHADGKTERVYTNGAREILFGNGTRKQVSADGQSIIVSFFNGDIKQILPDQRIVYYYADAQTTHTTYPDGLEILQFPNGQVEKHYPDGTKEITFPDQIIKYLFPSGLEESIFPDGTVIRVETSGRKIMEFPSGQREVHTGDYKRREYPDGTIKTVFPDGRQETQYASGRVRIKDVHGNVVVDRRA